MDLSKAFDTLNHDLLIAELEAYGLSVRSLFYIRSYLQNDCKRQMSIVILVCGNKFS